MNPQIDLTLDALFLRDVDTRAMAENQRQYMNRAFGPSAREVISGRNRFEMYTLTRRDMNREFGLVNYTLPRFKNYFLFPRNQLHEMDEHLAMTPWTILRKATRSVKQLEWNYGCCDECIRCGVIKTLLNKSPDYSLCQECHELTEAAYNANEHDPLGRQLNEFQ